MKILKNKFVIILFLMVVFLFFGSITNTLVLNNRGIVVGMGLDVDGEDITVACQILVAGDMGADTPNNDNYAVLSSSGKTFGEATQKMMVDSAEFMSYAHCNTVIVGKKIVESGRLFEVLDELLKNSKITENTYLVFYDGDTEEILKKKVGINLSTSFALQRMIGTADGYADISKCTIHDYLVKTTAPLGSVVLPEVKVEHQIDEPTTSNEQKGENKVILSARQGVVVSRDKFLGSLSSEEIGLYNLVDKDFERGTFAVTFSDGKKSVEFRKKQVEIKVDEKGQGKISLDLELVESDLINSFIGRSESEKEQAQKTVGDKLSLGIDALHQRFSSIGYDIFDLKKIYEGNFGKEKAEKIDQIRLKTQAKIKITT